MAFTFWLYNEQLRCSQAIFLQASPLQLYAAADTSCC